MTSGAQILRKSVRAGWTGHPGCSPRLPDTEVEGAWDGSWCFHVW
jgi:hypothetical protein